MPWITVIDCLYTKENNRTIQTSKTSFPLFLFSLFLLYKCRNVHNLLNEYVLLIYSVEITVVQLESQETMRSVFVFLTFQHDQNIFRILSFSWVRICIWFEIYYISFEQNSWSATRSKIHFLWSFCLREDSQIYFFTY